MKCFFMSKKGFENEVIGGLAPGLFLAFPGIKGERGRGKKAAAGSLRRRLRLSSSVLGFEGKEWIFGWNAQYLPVEHPEHVDIGVVGVVERAAVFERLGERHAEVEEVARAALALVERSVQVRDFLGQGLILGKAEACHEYRQQRYQQ